MQENAVRKKRLKRKLEYSELKIDVPLAIARRRKNRGVKDRRVKFFAFERMVFLPQSKGWAVEAAFHMVGVN